MRNITRERLLYRQQQAKEMLLTSCIHPDGGLSASGDGRYKNRYFGRDLAITARAALRYVALTGDRDVLEPTRLSLLQLAKFQGKHFNRPSGEQPGKILHDMGRELYPDVTRPEGEKDYWDEERQAYIIFDTVDATSLWLLAVLDYIEVAPDGRDFYEEIAANVSAALNWFITYGDSNADGFTDYTQDKGRGWLAHPWQGWMDHSDYHTQLVYPATPVEQPAYDCETLIRWGLRLKQPRLVDRALSMRERFNETFWVTDKVGRYPASYLQGDGTLLTQVRSSIGHLLYTTPQRSEAGWREIPNCIASDPEAIVRRLMAPDMFDEEAGIRTLSTKDKHYGSGHAHDDATWPHDNLMICQGFRNLGFEDEANRVFRAVFNMVEEYDNPGMEMVFFEPGKGFNKNKTQHFGTGSNKVQAWTLAEVLAHTAFELNRQKC